MQAYLFVHFREKTTPDGEQVYFGLSRDGFYWEEIAKHGSRNFSVWESENLTDWTEQRLVFFPCRKSVRSEKNLLLQNQRFQKFYRTGSSVSERGQRSD